MKHFLVESGKKFKMLWKELKYMEKGYQFKIIIKNSYPSVWRRIVVPEYINFAQLHEIIQAVFGWENDHLHEFFFPKLNVRIPGAAPFGDESMHENIRISDLMGLVKWFNYTYDFGDNWVHRIEIEKEVEEYPYSYPQVLKYKGNNYEEDSGGVFGSREEEFEDEFEGSDHSFENIEYSLSDMNEYLHSKFNLIGERKAIIRDINEIGTDRYKLLDIYLEPIIKKVKTYPNNPCPCGSGKKYKKCCG
jgi:hypothetical protein